VEEFLEANGTAEVYFKFRLSEGSDQLEMLISAIVAMPGEESGWDDFFSELKFFYTFLKVPQRCTFETIFTTTDVRKFLGRIARLHILIIRNILMKIKF